MYALLSCYKERFFYALTSPQGQVLRRRRMVANDTKCKLGIKSPMVSGCFVVFHPECALLVPDQVGRCKTQTEWLIITQCDWHTRAKALIGRQSRLLRLECFDVHFPWIGWQQPSAMDDGFPSTRQGASRVPDWLGETTRKESGFRYGLGI